MGGRHDSNSDAPAGACCFVGVLTGGRADLPPANFLGPFRTVYCNQVWHPCFFYPSFHSRVNPEGCRKLAGGKSAQPPEHTPKIIICPGRGDGNGTKSCYKMLATRRKWWPMMASSMAVRIWRGRHSNVPQNSRQ